MVHVLCGPALMLGQLIVGVAHPLGIEDVHVGHDLGRSLRVLEAACSVCMSVLTFETVSYIRKYKYADVLACYHTRTKTHMETHEYKNIPKRG